MRSKLYIKMNAIIIKQPIVLQTGTMKPKDVYIFNSQQTHSFESQVSRQKHRYQVVPLEEIISTLNPKTDIYKTGKIFVIRAGGIGDLLALSSLCKWLYYNVCPNIYFVTQEKYKCVLTWFEVPVKFQAWTKPVLRYDTRYKLNPTARQVNFEGVIERSATNWFELIFDNIDPVKYLGLETWGRPQLKDNSNLTGFKNLSGLKSVLFCLRATANIRSISFKDCYTAAKPYLQDCKLYVHETNLTKRDLEYINTLNDSSLYVLKRVPLHEYLDDVYAATMVISTDTGALHFREGLGKPALGIYSAFSSACRCKYYKYVKTIDIQSGCQYQPCFQHTNHHDDRCRLSLESRNDSLFLSENAPCLCSEFVPTLQQQLSSFFLNNLNL